MQLDRKTLAFLQMPSSKGDLYAPPSGSKALVHTFIFHNTNTTAEVVVLNYHDGTSENEIFSQSLAAGETITWTFKGAGDVVEDGGKYTGSTTTASKVTLKICGTEETPGNSVDFIEGERSNLWVPPETAHAYDDEFEGNVLSGWSGVQNITDAVAGSLSYDTIDAYDSTFTSGNVIRVKINDPIRPSWLQIQAPIRDKEFLIYKPIVFPTNLLIVIRAKFNAKFGSPANDATVGMHLCEATGGVPTYASRVQMWLNESDSTVQAQTAIVDSGGIGSGTVTTNDSNDRGQALEYVALHKIGSTFHAWAGTASGNWIWLSSHSGLDFTPDMIALSSWNSSVASPGACVVGYDFIRFFETDNFLL